MSSPGADVPPHDDDNDDDDNDTMSSSLGSSRAPLLLPGNATALLRCSSCAAPLAHDQRYCVECGARCAPVPPAVAAVIALRAAPSLDASDDRARADDGALITTVLSALSPRAMATAVMVVLAFGVFVGTVVSPAQPSGASEPVLVALAQPPQGASAAPSTSSAPPIPAATATPAAGSEAAPSSSGASSGPSSSQATKPKQPKRAAAPTQSTRPSGAAPASSALPPIGHVFLIVLSDQGYETAFETGTADPYLAKTLPAQGELLPGYYAVAGGELANEIALVSGQGPTPQTDANCPQYTALAPGTLGAEGQTLGSGCVYPPQTQTLPDQLTAAGKTWKAYVEGIEDGGPGQPTSCRHPTVGAADSDQAPSASDPYVTWRNPFVYFQSLTGGSACAQDDVGLGALATDLANATTTPSLAYIVPDRCDDGSEEACAPGKPSGLAAADAFLERVVPEIESSAAYKQGGLIAITFDQAPQSGPNADPSGCCTTAPYPNLPAGGATSSAGTATGAGSAAGTATGTGTATGAGTPPTAGTGTQPATASPAPAQTPSAGGKVGLLLLSKYVKPGSVDAIGQYNHFSLLLSIEKLFGLKPLGYAAAAGLLAFDKSVFSAYK